MSGDIELEKSFSRIRGFFTQNIKYSSSESSQILTNDNITFGKPLLYPSKHCRRKTETTKDLGSFLTSKVSHNQASSTQKLTLGSVHRQEELAKAKEYISKFNPDHRIDQLDVAPYEENAILYSRLLKNSCERKKQLYSPYKSTKSTNHMRTRSQQEYYSEASKKPNSYVHGLFKQVIS